MPANNHSGGVFMKQEKTQTQRILDVFVTSVILIVGITLVTSGIAVSKINTDYLESGVATGKIIAERDAQQISLTTHDGLKLTSEQNPETIKKVLTFLPPPINTTYMIAEEIKEIIAEYQKSDKQF